MMVGYNDSGQFVARGGSGASVTPTDCARLVIDTATYDFTDKSGSLTVTINVSLSKIDVEFDEDATGTVNYTGSFVASSSFANWSGANDGAIGNWAGSSLAGSETTTYLFNGTIGNCNFDQSFIVAPYTIEHWIHRSGNNIIGRWGFIDISALEELGGLNIQMNIGDEWKNVADMKLNVGDEWKSVLSAKININDSWKTIF